MKKTDSAATAGLPERISASWRGQSALVLLEQTLLLVIPLFLFFSLSDHLPVFSLCLLAIVSLTVLFIFRRRLMSGQRFGEFLLTRWLPMLALFVFVLGLWSLYHIGTLVREAGDSADYIRISKLSLSDINFWLFEFKTFVTPLIFKIFQWNWEAINVFFILLYLFSALLFIMVVTKYFPRVQEKILAFYLLLMFFLNQHSMSFWLMQAMTEAPTMAITLLVLAASGYSFLYQRRPNPKRGMTRLLIGANVLAAFVFSFSRDGYFYLLPFLLLFYLFVFKGGRQRVVLAFCMLAIFSLSAYSMKYSGRWKLPLANTLMRGIIPNPDLRRLFQEKYHLPADELVMPFAGKFAWDDLPNKEIIVDLQHLKGRPGDPLPTDWVGRYGMSAYTSYLIHHAWDVVQGWIGDWEIYNSNLWGYADAFGRMRNKKLNPFLFAFPGDVSFFMAVLILFFAILYFKQNPLILLSLFHAFVIGGISFIGDATEWGRHCQQASMTLKIAFLLFVLHAYTKIRDSELLKS